MEIIKQKIRPASIVVINSVLAFCIPALALIFWSMAGESFRVRYPIIYTMNPLTAILLIGCVGSFWMLAKKQLEWARLLSGIVLSIAILKLAGFLGVLPIKIDEYLFSSRIRGTLMAPNSALNFVLVSVALGISCKPNPLRIYISQSLSIIVFSIALLAITGHLYASLSLHTLPSYSPMSLHSAITFLFISSNLLLLQKRHGLMSEFTSGFVGGEIAKKLLPLVVIVPILLGWARIIGQNKGWYDREFGTALLIIAIIVISVIALWYLAHRLNKSDVEKNIAAKEMIAAKEKAEKAVRIKDSFLANMSHEIRTPLNSIIGFSEILGEKLKDEKLQGYVSNIQTSGRNLLSIVNEILDLAKLETASVELENQTFAITEPLEYVSNSLMPLLLNKPAVQYSSNIDNLLPHYFKGDSFRLSQILLNLANNSVKFTEQGTITIEVKLVELFEDSAMLEFSVQDTGMGVSPDKIENLFQPYIQGELSVTRRFGGTGLGLSIVKHLVKLFHGTITVSSKLGEGTLFKIRIPLLIGEAPIIKNVQQESVLALSELIPKLEGISVLIAEDHPANQRLFIEIFNDLPASIVMANNGKEAVEKLALHKFDIILMDLQMPEMNGIEATLAIRALQTDYKDIPILAITANIVGTDLQACLDSGMNGYISKPIHKLEMISKMVELITNKQSISTFDLQEIPSASETLFNADYLMEITGGDKSHISKMMEILLPDLTSNVQDTGGKIKAHLSFGAAQSLHRLKNTVAILQSTLLMEKITAAEQLAKNNTQETWVELEALWEESAVMLGLLKTEVENWYANI